MPQRYIYFSLYLMLCANELICSCRCWESSGSWNQFEVYRRNKLTWASHRLGNCHWIRTLNHLLPLLCLLSSHLRLLIHRLCLLCHLLHCLPLILVIFFVAFLIFIFFILFIVFVIFFSAVFLILTAFVFVCVSLAVYKPTLQLVSKQSVAKSNIFPVCSLPSLIRHQSLGTWLRSPELLISIGLCMLVMATLFMSHCHQAVSPLSGLLLSNPDLSELSQVKFIIPRGGH